MTLRFVWGIALMATAPAWGKEVIAEDSHGITLAVMQGDSAALQRVGQSSGVARLAARAGYYRTRGDLGQSSRWADACIADPAVLSENSQGTRYLCQSLRAGNRLLEGDIQGWARQMLQVQSIYQQHVAPSLGPGEEVRAVTGPAWEHFTEWPPFAVLSTPVVAGTRLPLQPISAQLGVPVIRVSLRGGVDGAQRDISADFIIDTGASRSHISRNAAARMGLAVSDGFATDTSRAEQPVAIGLAAPLDVHLGDLHFKDVAFTVTDGMDLGIIGLDLLYRLGPFVLDRQQLLTLDQVPKDVCREPLVTTSALAGSQYSLRLPMRIGTRQALVLLDTGANVGLEAAGVDLSSYPEAGRSQQRRVTMHGEQRVTYADATAPVMFNGHSAQLPTRVTDQPAQVFPIAWTVGFGLSDRYRYYVDVAGGRGCLASLEAD